MGYVTPQQVADCVPGLTINSSADVTTAAIQAEIDIDAQRINSYAALQGFSVSSPIQHQLDLLAALNLEGPAARIMIRRGGLIAPEYTRYANTIRKLGDYLNLLFEHGDLFKSWSSTTEIPSVELASVAECQVYAPSFTATTSTIPKSTTIQFWIKNISAVIYSIASVLGDSTPSDPTTLSTDVKNRYKNIVLPIVGSKVNRVILARNQDNPATLNTEANDLLLTGIKNLEDYKNSLFN